MSTYTPIATQTLSTSATSVTFSGIPQTYTDLVAVISNVKNNFAGTGGVYDRFMRFNGDSGANYSVTNLTGNGSTASSNRFSNDNHFSASFPRASDEPGNIIAHIQNYANTTTNKTVLWRTTNPSVLTTAAVGLWRNTAAITSITFIVDPNSFVSGTVFTLYGIGAGSPKAFGGDEVRTDGTYWYHIYLSSGIFAPMQNLSCDYLVIAGGGGGAAVSSAGAYGAPGGGAGGYRTTVGTSGGGGSAESALSLVAGSNYSVIIGAGGASNVKGTDTTFASITSAGGGSRVGGAGALSNGGSGAGTFDFESPPGAGTANQGFAGGQGSATTAPGGGGGAGGAGSTTRQGGVGLTSSISGSSVGRAGGGGGGYTPSSNATDGGGSGGLSSGNNNGSNGTANTGGGGGGASVLSGSTNFGGNGGSGIVIVRYSA